jgi:acetate kinase
MTATILSVNSGSSSIKFALHRLGPKEVLLGEGAVERIGLADGWFHMNDGQGSRVVDEHLAFDRHIHAVRAIFGALEDQALPVPDAVGHRIVHGGPHHAAPELVTQELVKALRKLIPVAPLHMPSEIMGIEAVTEHYPDLQQVVCFDTAFHATIPELALRLPLPRSFWQEGIRRYGFHGLSYEYVVSVLGEEARKRVIIAHLGNGASMVAVKDGRSIETTMGFSPIAGLMMGTRCGSLDPGVSLYLLSEKGYDADRLAQLLSHESGLLGVSGMSSDMKTLLEHRAADAHAAQAVDMFCYHARKAIGSLAAVLGGLDVLVFTGGMGERAAPVRWAICRGLDYLGIQLNPHSNDLAEDVISSSGSSCTVRIVATNEDLMIARHTAALLAEKKGGNG